MARKSHKPVRRDHEYGRLYHKPIFLRSNGIHRSEDVCNDADKAQVVSIEDTVQFGELSPIGRQKQFISFAITVGNQRIAVMISRLTELSTKNEKLSAVDKVEFDVLMDSVKHLSFMNELLKNIALNF